MVAGSFVSSIYGIPRATQDVDIVIAPTFDSLNALLALLARDECYVDADVARDEFRRHSQFNVIDEASGWKVDFIFRKSRPFSRTELARRVPMNILGVSMFAASAEDTILSKLEWAKLGESERQLRDVRGILDTQGNALDFAYIEQWLDELEVRELWDRVRS
ncbi:hypothetical protein LVJ94_38805 [Pendulispora rubella]|uniref:Polymerase nucleotidyl transferase domain-containing protein n=1 Tax=Pendulispora rubella TaxID=2741070 RepID=A0ABZ2KXP1_9BACT